MDAVGSLAIMNAEGLGKQLLDEVKEVRLDEVSSLQ